MTTVDSNRRGWGVEPKKKTQHKGGGKSASRGVVELTRDNIVEYLSSRTYAYVSRKSQRKEGTGTESAGVWGTTRTAAVARATASFPTPFPSDPRNFCR